jgi:hypothetical protein
MDALVPIGASDLPKCPIKETPAVVQRTARLDNFISKTTQRLRSKMMVVITENMFPSFEEMGGGDVSDTQNT